MKKTIILSLTLMLVLGLATGCGCDKKKNNKTEKEPEIKQNTNKEVIKDQEFEGIKFTNTSLTVVDGISTFEALAVNETSADYFLNEFTITVKDAKGDVIIELPGYVGDVIKAGQSKSVNSSVDIDLSKAGSVEYSVKK